MFDSLIALFASSFLSSTLLPGSSEALLIYQASGASANLLVIVVVATIGNTLGGMTGWLIGWGLAKRWRPRSLDAPTVRRVQRWGAPIMLLSWLPVIGDPLGVAAGYLRVNPLACVFWMALGKGLRYAVLAYGVSVAVS